MISKPGMLRAPLIGGLIFLLAACGSAPANVARPTLEEVGIYSAGQGSGFLPYAQGMAAYLIAQGQKARAIESRGSIENVQKLDEEAHRLATVFMGTAFEGYNGAAAWTQGKKYTSLRALFPMYETSFQLVSLRTSGVTTLRQLAGKRVGVGPAGGPGESFFKGLAESIGLQVQTVTGTPVALAADLQSGAIDALWQGASMPIPVIRQVTDTADAVVFGLTDDELAAMLKRFPFLSPTIVPAQTYRGQSGALKSVAGWNFVLAHKDLPDAEAYFITKTVLSAGDPKAIHSSALPTRTANAPTNTVVPFHPGALRFYTEQGLRGLNQAP